MEEKENIPTKFLVFVLRDMLRLVFNLEIPDEIKGSVISALYRVLCFSEQERPIDVVKREADAASEKAGKSRVAVDNYDPSEEAKKIKAENNAKIAASWVAHIAASVAKLAASGVGTFLAPPTSEIDPEETLADIIWSAAQASVFSKRSVPTYRYDRERSPLEPQEEKERYLNECSKLQ